MTEKRLASSSQIADAFIARWQGQEGGQERANYALFLTELCDVLGLPHPDPAGADRERNDYVFERVVTRHRDEGDTIGRIDLYRKNSFVLEAKQSRLRGGTKEIAGQQDLFAAQEDMLNRGKRGADRAWDVLMLNAKRQAEDYARALPASHGWPPFILVCDVGHCIEVYADFTGQGKNYTQFPDRQSFRVYMEDLRKEETRERLKAIWLDPQSLDPTRTRARVTRDIAGRLAQVSKALEAKKYPPEQVAHFLMRCLFTMFASSVKLLPENAFTELLNDARKSPDSFIPLLEELWRSMNEGTFSTSIRKEVLRFNGNLFAEAKALPLGREEIGELYEAALKDWHEVEPAIFGTLLEQALDPAERKRLGAHYTPRAYVERLVVATIIEPLREDWRNVQAAAETKRAAGDRDGAADAVKAIHDKLCETRVLDPACGTGNFLYVSMELMKRLEGEVLEALLDLGGQEALRGLGSHTVDPHQFLGLEINPRAAAIAELVLWIGYLQWHFRTRSGLPDQPILRKFKNIEIKNAVLTWDGYPKVQFVNGKEYYKNPSQPTWPSAEFIVGNPPFIGNKRLKERLGEDYVGALRAAHSNVPGSVDLVMYWFYHCGSLLKRSAIRRFGLVVTNSVIQPLNRPGLNFLLEQEPRCSLSMAIPDHPWVDVEKGAAVRVAMLSAQQGVIAGKLVEIVTGTSKRGNAAVIAYRDTEGLINTRLNVGTDVTVAKGLLANRAVSQQGVILVGEGFRLTRTERAHYIGLDEAMAKCIRPYEIGNDLTDIPEERYVVDVNELTEERLRTELPHIYQLLVQRVRPERLSNNDKAFREFWWRWGRRRPEIADLAKDQPAYVATCRTARYRVFVRLPSAVVPDAKIIFIGLSDYYFLGIVSSHIHVTWSLAAGAWLGAGNDSNYNHSDCFDPFPFPSPGELLKAKIRSIAQELDAHRKQRQKEHSDLTLTQMYTVLEKLKTKVPLDEDDEAVKDKGLILLLQELHERLDALVFEAYDWPQTLPEEQILERLVALNHERAAEERRGHVRWLRPDYQISRFGAKLDKQATQEEGAQVFADLGLPEPGARKPSFPTDGVEQIAAVFAALASARQPVDVNAIAAGFRKAKNLEKSISDVLASLSRLGHVSTTDGRTFQLRRVA